MIVIYPIQVTSQKYISKIREEFPIIRKKETLTIDENGMVLLSYFPVISGSVTITGNSATEYVDYEWISKNDGIFEVYDKTITGKSVTVDYYTSSFTDEQILSVLKDALYSHNFERKTTYTFSDLPDNEFPLVIWLTKALLCFDKSKLILDSVQYSDIKSGRVSNSDTISLGMGGFSISAPMSSGQSSNQMVNSAIARDLASAWQSLGQKFQDKYNERMGLGQYRNLIVEKYPKIKVSTYTRKRYKDNKVYPYEAVRAPEAVTLSDAEVSGGNIRISWTANYDEEFYIYKVVADKNYISTPSGNEYEENITDNHTTTATITGLSGTYYIAVYVYDTNLLYSRSNVITVTV